MGQFHLVRELFHDLPGDVVQLVWAFSFRRFIAAFPTERGISDYYSLFALIERWMDTMHACGWVDYLSYEFFSYHRDCFWRRSGSFQRRLLPPFWGCMRAVYSWSVGILTDLEESEKHGTVLPCWELQAITYHYSSPDCSEGEMFPSDLAWHYSALWDWSRGQYYTPRSFS